MAGWVVRASGDSEDPNVHHDLLERLREVLRQPEAGTGSSEYTSPHVSESNFHVNPARSVAPDSPPAAT